MNDLRDKQARGTYAVALISNNNMCSYFLFIHF